MRKVVSLKPTLSLIKQNDVFNLLQCLKTFSDCIYKFTKNVKDTGSSGWEIVHACHIAMSLLAKVSAYEINSCCPNFSELSKPFSEWALVN